MAVPKHHIREAVARYVSGEITRQALQEWFAPAAWELLGGDPSPAAELAGEMELLFAESTSEGWGDNELRQRLAEAAAVPLSWMLHVESTLSISVSGGPLQNTIQAHQETFWVRVTNEEVEQAA